MERPSRRKTGIDHHFAGRSKSILAGICWKEVLHIGGQPIILAGPRSFERDTESTLGFCLRDGAEHLLLIVLIALNNRHPDQDTLSDQVSRRFGGPFRPPVGHGLHPA